MWGRIKDNCYSKCRNQLRGSKLEAYSNELLSFLIPLFIYMLIYTLTLSCIQKLVTDIMVARSFFVDSFCV